MLSGRGNSLADDFSHAKWHMSDLDDAMSIPRQTALARAHQLRDGIEAMNDQMFAECLHHDDIVWGDWKARVEQYRQLGLALLSKLNELCNGALSRNAEGFAENMNAAVDILTNKTNDPVHALYEVVGKIGDVLPHLNMVLRIVSASDTIGAQLILDEQSRENAISLATAAYSRACDQVMTGWDDKEFHRASTQLHHIWHLLSLADPSTASTREHENILSVLAQLRARMRSMTVRDWASRRGEGVQAASPCSHSECPLPQLVA